LAFVTAVWTLAGSVASAQTPDAESGSRHEAEGGVPGGRLSGVIGPPIGPTKYDTPPVLRRETRPRYPEIAFAAGMEGDVVVEALVDVRGRVTKTRLTGELSCDSETACRAAWALEVAARECVAKWRYEPAKEDGHPTPLVVNVLVSFRLAAERSRRRHAETAVQR
jgi:TonB family protein